MTDQRYRGLAVQEIALMKSLAYYMELIRSYQAPVVAKAKGGKSEASPH